MAEFPLLPIPTPEPDQRPPGPGGGNNLHLPGRARQGERLEPVFQRLRAVFKAGRDPLTLLDDPAGIAPERALVLEIAGTIDQFHNAVGRVHGLELLGDEETEFEADIDFAVRDARKGRIGERRHDKPVGGRLYLAMPDTRALRELVSLWDHYQAGHPPESGFAPWYDVFGQLYRLRPWGPLDRIPEDTIAYLNDHLADRPDSSARLEIELWSSQSTVRQRQSNLRFDEALRSSGGEVVERSSIPEIAYEAVLVDLPADQIHPLIQRQEVSLAICDSIMFVRPQSMALFPTSVTTLGAGEEVEAAPAEHIPPIAAVFDGVPVQRHRLLDRRLWLDDPDGLDSLSVVSERRHGTEMASLILHGDRNVGGEPSLTRPLYFRPVLFAPGNGSPEQPQSNRLLIDTVYRAVRQMKVGDSENRAAAPEVFIANLSLGDESRPFTGPMSPWGRLLDYLAERFGILFVVSAGNIFDPLPVPEFTGTTELEAATMADRQKAILKALDGQRSQRTLLSPAEALNVITVGAWYEDAVGGLNGSSVVYEPYEHAGPNITSAMGLGHRKVVKPDIFMPGGRELFSVYSAGRTLGIRRAPPGRLYGLRAAIPDPGGRLDQEGLTAGTSAAAALASRAAHRLFDALSDQNNGGILSGVDPMYYGVVVKALLVHRARWGGLGSLLDGMFRPTGQGSSVARKDNITRVLGYGPPIVEEAMSCASNRATLVGYGEVPANGPAVRYKVPLPASLERVTEPRSITLTLAWFSPVNVRHRAYRRAKLEIKPDRFSESIGVSRVSSQPSDKSVPRGSLFHVHYEGDSAVPFIDDGHLQFLVFCRNQGGSLDGSIRYGVAVTIEAGEHIPVYQQVRQRLGIQPRVAGAAP